MKPAKVKWYDPDSKFKPAGAESPRNTSRRPPRRDRLEHRDAQGDRLVRGRVRAGDGILLAVPERPEDLPSHGSAEHVAHDKHELHNKTTFATARGTFRHPMRRP